MPHAARTPRHPLVLILLTALLVGDALVRRLLLRRANRHTPLPIR